MKLLSLAAAVALATVASASQAAAISSFSFNTTGGFLNDGGATCNVAADPGCDLRFYNGVDPSYHGVAWGQVVPAAQSHLDITHYSGDVVVNSGSWTNIDQFNHTNNVIPVTASSWFMSHVNVSGILTFPSFPGPPPFPEHAYGATYGLTFLETPNVDTCAQLDPSGSHCDDYFVTQALQGVQDIYTDVDGAHYILELRYAAGDNATVYELPGSMIGIYTAEGKTSTIYTQARITSTVDEPGILALFGLGLFGVAIARRRNAKV